MYYIILCINNTGCIISENNTEYSRGTPTERTAERQQSTTGGGVVELNLVGTGREVRHAVMASQFGWGVYAVCEYKAGERLGWYDGERMTAEQWAGLGSDEGYEHTVRTSWAGRQARGGQQCYINGIDGVAGMQYINTAYGRGERERLTGQPEYGEKVKFKYNRGRVVVAVKDGQRIKAGEELRVQGLRLNVHALNPLLRSTVHTVKLVLIRV